MPDESSVAPAERTSDADISGAVQRAKVGPLHRVSKRSTEA